MSKAKTPVMTRTNEAIRALILRYFYDRNKNATSARGKKGSAVKISNVKAELKAAHGLSQQEVQSNLSYLIDQGWVKEEAIAKSFTTPTGTVVPSTTSFYKITAPGIDKIEGEGEFTMDKFHGIKIEANGQNIITLGDGNQINAKFSDLGTGLVDLKKAIEGSDARENDKINFAADIDTIQSQLAKPSPNKGIISAAWSAVKAAATINGCATLVHRVGTLIDGTIG